MANYAGANNVFALNGVIAYAPVNANFAGIISHMDTHLMHRDALLPFTGLVSGPSSSCVSADQLARKAYVDAVAVLQTADTDAKTGMVSGGASAGSISITYAGVWYSGAEVAIVNPGKAVTIMGWGSGFLQGPVANSVNEYRSRLSYSVDNGATYTNGPEQYVTAEAGDNPWRSFAPILHVAQGAAVNNIIKVKVEFHLLNQGSPLFTTVWQPAVMAQVFQQVAV